jgi:MinD-like ATPase involved in chromosome partitioning or flagellar assembly
MATKIPFKRGEMMTAWRQNLAASQFEPRNNAHRLLLFYAVECGLKAVIMKREKLTRTDQPRKKGHSVDDFGHDINRLLDELRVGAKIMILRSWFDVERLFREKTNGFTNLPTSIWRIDCFYDTIEIGLTDEKQQSDAKDVLKEWFKGWFDQTESVIYLDIDDATLPVEFIIEEKISDKKNVFRPFWDEVEYITEKTDLIQFPAPFSDDIHIIAFHSFKGGVGRTSHLAACLFALLDQAKALKRDIKILAIDADLESPGFTYWHQKLQPTVSIIDFLEAYHYPPTDSVIAFYAKELKKSYLDLGFYVLPACLENKQLLDIRILPEHLARGIDGAWECSHAIEKLAKAIGANYVLIDLRAGLSEIASPILFDPRIERYLITTLSEQSVSGTKLILEKLSKLAPSLEEVETGKYLDPKVVISMLKQDLKASPIYENVLQVLAENYQVEETDDVQTQRLTIEETFFAEQLLYFYDWADARNKINDDTTLMQWARQWAKDALTQGSEQTTDYVEVKRLKEICQRYEYAENGEGDDLLVTQSLRNLALNHVDSLPRVVSIGAKGAGKTFNYVQLANLRRWNNFLEKNGISSNTDSFIFPLLQSSALKDKALTKIKRARDEFASQMSELSDFSPNSVKDEIKTALCNHWQENEWVTFWIDTLFKVLNKTIAQENNQSKLANLDAYLKQKQVRVIFLIDGLEDIFSEIASNPEQQIALRALLDIPNRLGEIRQANLGIIIFLRRDFLRHTILQNQGQFENLYRAYDLSWDFESFLRLVYWLCAQAKIIGAVDKVKLNSKELSQFLEHLWGKKLGRDNSREALTVNWVYAALTDLNGQLQARDIVRLLLHAADYALRNKDVFETWKNTRLLPPQAVRSSVEPCSIAKVKEAKVEYPVFKEWADSIDQRSSDELKIPFDPEQLDMKPKTIEMLKDIGVIYEDKQKNEATRFYIPEIFRAGLGFTYAGGARQRVLFFKRKALGTS